MFFNVNLLNRPILYESLRLITRSAINKGISVKLLPHWFTRLFITKFLFNDVYLYDVIKNWS